MKLEQASIKILEELGIMAGEKEELGVTLGVTLGVNETKIIEQILENNSITLKELAKKVGISEVSIYKNIEKLKGKKVLRRLGSDKTGHWEIILREDNKKAKDDNKQGDEHEN